MKKFILLLSVFAFVACNDDKDDNISYLPSVPEPQRLLTVEVSEDPMQGKGAMTKAAVITTASLSKFWMNYQDLYKYDFTKTGDTWNTATWPASVDSDDKIDFYAYNGGTFTWNGGAPYVSFTQEESAFYQKDLLVATHKQISYNDNAGKVSLLFDHACAAVQFYIYKQEAADYVVKSVVLKDVAKQGSYHYNSNSWTDVNTKTDYTLTNGDIAPSTTPTLLPCEGMFFIPQEKSAIGIEVTYTKNGSTQKTKTLHMASGTWQAGYQYTEKIKIGN